MDTTIVSEELAAMGIDARIEISREDASRALDRALPRETAKRLCERLQSRGVLASLAQDHDDYRMAWVHL